VTGRCNGVATVPGSRRTRLLWLTAAAALLCLLGLTLALISGGWVVSTDRSIELQVLVHQHRWPRHAATALSWLGDPLVVGVVVMLATVVLAVRRDLVRAVALPVVALASLVLGQLARHVIGRSSPTDGSHLRVTGGQGYPSGHALGAAVCVGAVAVAARRVWVSVTAIVLAVLAAAARVYLFAHFPSDVVASLLGGAAAMATVEAAAGTVSTRRRGG
jgi:membrane-associated phospholipid phosphatase